MRLAIILQLATSCLTLISMYLAGNGDQRFNIIGIFANGGWWTFTITQGAWGLAPLNAALLIVYIRNLIRWRKQVNGPSRENRK